MNLLHFKPVDRLPAVHFGYWDELLTEWAEQGKIPKRLAEKGNRDGSPEDEELDRLIGWDFNWVHTPGSNNRLFPRFERKVLEELPGGVKRVQNHDGLIEKIFTTNLVYRPAELRTRDWYVEVNMCKYVAYLVENLHHDESISNLLNPSDRISTLMQKHLAEVASREG